MKVAYLIGSLNRGGTETLLLDVFRNAGQAPYEMMCVHRKGGAYQEDFYATCPKIVKCAPKRFGLIRYLVRLRQLLKHEDVAIVHAQQPIDCVYAWLATIGTDIRVVETFHGYDYGIGKISRWIYKWSILMADAAYFVSKAQRDYYIKAFHIRNCSKLQVVYNGIDFGKLDAAYPLPDVLEGRKKIQLAMVGNFVRVRAQMVIAKSIQVLKQQGVSNFDFYFVGRRDDAEPWRYDECVKFCEEKGLKNVHFVGGRGDVPAILQNIDGFVYATDHDTFGIAVVEAMAAGLPVVVNDWEVMREVCGEENHAVRYYKTGDSIDCAKTIKNLLEELAESKKEAEKNAKIIRKKYAIQEHVNQLYKAYAKQ